jgi:hypothetical protein
MSVPQRSWGAIDLAVAEAEPPTGGVPSVAGARKQPRYTTYDCFYNLLSITLLINIFSIFLLPSNTNNIFISFFSSFIL